MNSNEFLWTEKYRPQTVKDTILPVALKATFQQFVDQKNVPNLLLSGRAGTGKTTVARAMLEEIGSDYMMINASLDGSKATLQNDITQFATSTSLEGNGRKYVILDEADYLSPHFQPGLRNFMEEYSQFCGFILTCNYRGRIIKEIKSRCSEVEFRIPLKEKRELATAFCKRLKFILDTEKIEYDKAVLGEVIKRFYPDWRHTLLETQVYAATGKIDVGMLNAFPETNIKALLTHVKAKDFTETRKWFAQNQEHGVEEFYSQIYQTFSPHLVAASVPEMILILARYQYQAAFAASQEINSMACITEIMGSCRFKE